MELSIKNQPSWSCGSTRLLDATFVWSELSQNLHLKMVVTESWVKIWNPGRAAAPDGHTMVLKQFTAFQVAAFLGPSVFGFKSVSQQEISDVDNVLTLQYQTCQQFSRWFQPVDYWFVHSLQMETSILNHNCPFESTIPILLAALLGTGLVVFLPSISVWTNQNIVALCKLREELTTFIEFNPLSVSCQEM